MRNPTVTALVLCALAAAAWAGAPVPRGPAGDAGEIGAAAPPRDVLLDSAAMEQEIDRLLESATAARALAESPAGPAGQRALERELEELRTRLVALRQTVREAPAGIPAPTTVVEVAAPPGPPAPARLRTATPDPMAREDFEEAFAALEARGFAGERLDVLSELCRHNWFVVEQARRLIESFSFGKDRLQALELLAPRIVDRQNDFRLFEAFTFESDKAQARRILSAQQP
jgi:hypothetical protein